MNIRGFFSFSFCVFASAIMLSATTSFAVDPLHEWTFEETGVTAFNTGTSTDPLGDPNDAFNLTMVEKDRNVIIPVEVPTDFHTADGGGVGGVGRSMDLTNNEKDGSFWEVGALGSASAADPGVPYSGGMTITGWVKSDGFENHPDSPGSTIIRQGGAWWMRTTSRERLEFKIEHDFSNKTITSRNDLLEGIDEWTFFAFTWAGPNAVPADAPANAEDGYVMWYRGDENSQIVDWSRSTDTSETPAIDNPAYITEPMFATTAADFRFGHQNSNDGGWDGFLDEFRIYDSALSYAEIEAIRLEGGGTVDLPGDFNADNTVNGEDFLAWQRNPTIGNLSDWQDNYGSSVTAALSAIPEPSSLLLAFASSAIFASTRRRRLTS